MKGSIEDNSRIFFSKYSTKNICCDPSLELLVETVLRMGHNIRFKGVIWKIIFKLSILPRLIWSTVRDAK